MLVQYIYVLIHTFNSLLTGISQQMNEQMDGFIDIGMDRWMNE